jgi:hypothetical protein
VSAAASPSPDSDVEPGTGDDDPPGETPDARRVRLHVAGYAAVVVVAVAATALATVPDPPLRPDPLHWVGAAVAVAGVVAVGLERLAPDRFDALDGRRAAVRLAAPGGVLLGVGLLAAAWPSPTALEGGGRAAAVVGGGVVAVAGVAVVGAVRQRRAALAVARGAPAAVWRAGRTGRARVRRAVGHGAGSVVVLGVLNVGLDGRPELLAPSTAIAVVFAVGAAVAPSTDRRFEAHDAGLVVGRSVGDERLHAWDSFDGVAASEDALRLRRPFPWPDVVCRRADLEEPATVERTLRRRLR